MKNICLALLLISGFSFRVHCQGREEKIKVPMLAGHQVSIFQYMQDSKINSNMRFEIGVAESGKFTADGLPVGDTTIFQLSSELVYVGMRLGYQQKVKDWIGFFVNAEYTARLGTGVESIISQGVNTILKGSIGIKFKLVECEYDRLTGYTKISNTEATIINVKQYVWGLINGIPSASLDRAVPALHTGGGLSYTHVFSPLIGINIDGQLVYGERLERGSNSWLYFAGANLDFDFDSAYSLPISLLVGGYANTQINSFSLDGDLSSTFTARIQYTGSRDYTFGIEFFRGQTPVDTSGRRVKVEGFSFVSQFYF